MRRDQMMKSHGGRQMSRKEMDSRELAGYWGNGDGRGSMFI